MGGVGPWPSIARSDRSTNAPQRLTKWRSLGSVVVAQLLERSLPTLDVRSSNPLMGNFFYWTFMSTVKKTKIKKKRSGMVHFLKKWDPSLFILIRVCLFGVAWVWLGGSVTRLELFWNVLGTKCPQILAQKLVTFWTILNICSVKVTNCFGYFLAIFSYSLATFYSDIWSHCWAGVQLFFDMRDFFLLSLSHWLTGVWRNPRLYMRTYQCDQIWRNFATLAQF